MKPNLSRLSPTDRQAIAAFRQRVKTLIGHQLVAMTLFGSKARGDAVPESDIDIFITVDKRSPELEDRIIDIAFDVNLQYGVYISPRVVSTQVLQDPVWSATPFLQHVAKEGIPI